MSYGLLGNSISHSFSPKVHNLLGDYSYRLFDVPESDVDSFMRSKEFSGINVTIPYKERVMSYIDELSEEARQIGCVNTVIKRPDGSLYGHNTDCYGFTEALKSANINPSGKKCLVLGSGGASKMVQYALPKLGAREVVVISRSGENNYENLDRHYDAELIVNTTPVGMSPNNSAAPISLAPFKALTGVMDLIYNPLKTRLLLEAERLGIPFVNGLYMLVAQAKAAAELFMGESIPDEKIGKVTAKIAERTRNIVLVGMPGCGKSTIAEMLAQKLWRDLIDTDVLVKKYSYGLTPEEVIETDGEAAFRRMEAAAVREAGRKTGMVIATGGGVVVTPENFDELRQNSIVIFLNRPVAELATAGRPLSEGGKSNVRLYNTRLPLYQAISDIEIKINDFVGIDDKILYRISCFDGTDTLTRQLGREED